MRRIAVILFLALAWIGCAAEQTDQEPAASAAPAATPEPVADRDTIIAEVERVRSQWQEAAERDDAAAVTALYTEDAIVVSPEDGTARGREAIEELWTRNFPMVTSLSIDPEETDASGDLAYDFGTFTQTVDPPDAEPVEMTGQYLVVLKRDSDGAWRLVKHISYIQPPEGSGASFAE